MSIALRCTATVLSLALGALVTDASAQQVSGASGHRGSATPATSVSVSPKQRGEMARQFVTKWGGYVQRVYNVPVRVWSQRMVSNFASADAANFRDALKRDTFEGAMAQLSGSGHRLSDERVINKFATMKAGSGKVLGSLSGDLVYTPVQPCRIFDTRNTGAGPIAANSTRSFVSINQANFTAQGGSATDCGTLGLNATAVAINLTAVTPAAGGYATVYPFGTTQPLAASVNYTAGAFVNNGIIAQIPNPLTTSDFTIYSFAESHYVADIVGYFAPPQATPLGCVTTFATQNVAASSPFNFAIPACPSGYTVTGAGCRTPGLNEANWAINGLYRNGANIDAYCAGLNTTAGTITIEGTAQCCRVPGR